MNYIYAVYDVNETYAKRLINAIHQVMMNKNEKHFETQLFTEESALEEYLACNMPAVLITSETSYCQTVAEQFTGTKVILTEENMDPEIVRKSYGSQAVGIYRYQTAEKILKELIEKCPVQCNKTLGKIEMIGVYTPITSEQKTSFVLNMAKVLSEKYRVLYLNFDEFSGLEELLGNESDMTLSDALYYYRQGQQNAGQKISETINHVAGIDYIAPVRCAEDLSFMEAEQMIDFIEVTGKNNHYEIVLADISHALKQPWKILGFCDCVYMPVKDDYLSQRKIQDFETYFIGSGLETLLDNNIKVHIPAGESEITQMFWEKIKYGGMYRFVKTLLDQRRQAHE